MDNIPTTQESRKTHSIRVLNLSNLEAYNPQIENGHAQGPPLPVCDRHMPPVPILGEDGTPLTYDTLYGDASSDPDEFWSFQARSLLSWEQPFSAVRQGSFEGGDVRYFAGGKLNASYNCVDRHAMHFPEKPAIIFESDDPAYSQTLTYEALLHRVSKLSWVLRSFGVKKGDVVAIYMPTSPEAFTAVLACARIGAMHSCVFAGFSANALRDRILDADCKIVITADETVRGVKRIDLKALADAAIAQCPGVLKCLVFRRSSSQVAISGSRDACWGQELSRWPPYSSPECMDAESPLFLLYTSGSTGKPKGLMHTTAGYLLGAATTGKFVFDIRETDRFFCEGDIGWISRCSFHRSNFRH
jgi:acetyl-CoA synthetase